MDRKSTSGNARRMNSFRTVLVPVLAIIQFWPQPANAMQAGTPAADYAAEQCVSYNRAMADSFNLVNNCDTPIEVALCAEAESGACTQPQNFVRHIVTARGQLPDTFRSLQILNIFACKSPAVVQLGQGGLAGCDPTGLANLPLLLASSLKNAASIITASDYPAGVAADGNTRFEMRVGADGKPQSCFVTVSSGKDALDKATCNAFMKRARFTPAKDSSGRATDGRYRGNVTWKER